MKTKHSRFTSSFVFGAALLLGGHALAAQRFEKAAAPADQVAQAIALQPRPAIVHYDMPGDGALWVRGQDYKMSFNEAGATYYPRFGARQPHNVPLVLSPDIVSSSGALLAFDGSAAATRSGDRVEIDRGTFVEAYDLTPEAIEQTFMFQALPTRGDLVLHIPVATELEGRAAAEGLEFGGEFGHVSYSRAVAIDAAGRRTDVATELQGGAIELRIDAQFLADAALPLVIDPVVATFPVASGANDNYSTDVAWHDNYFCWFIVYEETYSATDHDLYARIMNVDGTVRHQGYVDYTVTNWTRPRCAALYGANQFFVVSATASGGIQTVRGRLVSALDLAMQSHILISRVEDGPCYNPVVGGDPYPGLPSSYAVAYERRYSATDTDILVRRVNPDNTLAGTEPIFLSNSGESLDHQPAISKSNDSDEWMITWHREFVGGNADIYGARVQYDSTVTQGPFQVTTSPTREIITSVSSPVSNTHRHLVAFQSVVAGDSDISVALVDGFTTQVTLNLSEAEGFDPARNQVEPSVDCDGSHFAVAYSERDTGGDYDMYVSEVALAGTFLTVTQAHRNLALSSTHERRPAIASYAASGGTLSGMQRRYVIAWEDLGTADANIEGAMFDGQEGGTKVPYCFGDGTGAACPCGNFGGLGRGCANSVNALGAVLHASGIASPTNDTVVLHGIGMPDASCLYFQGTLLATNVFGDGLRCVSGTTIRLATKTNAGGSSQYPGPGDQSVHVRGQIPAAGGTRFYQAWYRNAASFCTPSGFNLSNGLMINWVP